jgi:hypothetical protein
MVFPMRALSALTVCLACATARPAPQTGGDPNPEPTRTNTNALITKHRAGLKLSASSTWPGWPPEKALDGNLQTSWFSAQDDSAAHGRKTWFQVTFPEDVMVRRVTVLGNREPAWLEGFTILAAGLELLDADGKRLKYEESDGAGKFYDYDFVLARPIPRVRSIRLTALGDQGKKTQYGDVAIAEFLVE